MAQRRSDWVALVQLAAIVSLSLGLTNLLPVPLLDGGHLLFYALEAARGRPLGRRSQEFSLRAGAALVLMLMAVRHRQRSAPAVRNVRAALAPT